jgi:hypothetical protein
MIPFQLSTGDAGDVQTDDGEGAITITPAAA